MLEEFPDLYCKFAEFLEHLKVAVMPLLSFCWKLHDDTHDAVSPQRNQGEYAPPRSPN